MADNREATRSGERARMAQVAEDFDAIISRLLEARRDGSHLRMTDRDCKRESSSGISPMSRIQGVWVPAFAGTTSR